MPFREGTTVIHYLQVFLSVLQDLNSIGVLLSRGSLALITRDPFQPLKGLLIGSLIQNCQKSVPDVYRGRYALLVMQNDKHTPAK